MADETKATATTSEGDGKKTEGNSSGAGTQTAKTEGAELKFTQDDLDRVAAKTRDEEREKLKKAKEKEDKEREEAKAKEQGEFQKLADGYKKELDEAKPKLERLDQYVQAVKALAESELKGLPEEVRDMAPSIDSPLDVLAWLPKGKALAEKIAGVGKKARNGGDPKLAGGFDPQADEAAKKSQAGMYRSF